MQLQELEAPDFIASTESVITPAAANTTFTGEISTNGLARIEATTKTHSAGTNSTTIEHTFTASGAFTSVLASALFNAASVGNNAPHSKLQHGLRNVGDK